MSPRLRLHTPRNPLASDSVACHFGFWIADFGLIENQKSKIENPVTLLTLDKVSKSFGGVVAVRGVSLTVEAGEILGVMGPNGSGKTTLFNLVSGALVPDSGEIHFLGGRTNGLEPHRICHRGLARTFQLVRPFLGLTVLENVLVGLGYGCQRLTGRARRVTERKNCPRSVWTVNRRDLLTPLR